MIPRKRPTFRQQAEIILQHEGRCAICCKRFFSLDEIEWDHTQALALGGDNETENFRALCGACHSEKTNGRPATTHGSDKHAIAKAKRIARGGKKKQPGPKSRGFDKRWRKPMRGKAERRT